MGAGASMIPGLEFPMNKEAAAAFVGANFDEAAFTEAAGEEGTIDAEKALALYNKSMKNSALIFIKPHANLESTQTFVRDAIKAKGLEIVAEGAISGTDIDEKKLIDNHYYAIASKATILKPDALPVPADKFEEFFKEPWAAVLEAGRAVNAMDACAKWECDADTLEAAWRACEPAGKVVKFGGGFYCGLVEMEGKDPLYVFNAFFMSMRSKFVGETNSIFYFSVEWKPETMAWADFRGKFIGGTDPSEAPTDSLRGHIAAKWEELGMTAGCTKGDNGVHASASPLEGLSEKLNWLGKGIADESFGAALQKFGVSEESIKAWCVDARVKVPQTEGEPVEASIFDSLEDKDAADCLALCTAINGLASA